MNLILDLLNIPEEIHIEFCNYIINYTRNKIENNFPFLKCKKMEKYIEDHNIIQWQNKRKDHISVYNIYRLVASNLKIKILNQGKYNIYLDPVVTIPNSYTKLYSICSLLEYGTLSIKKCGILTDLMQAIANNLDSLYAKFLLENNK